jgi:hypothetical protein
MSMRRDMVVPAWAAAVLFHLAVSQVKHTMEPFSPQSAPKVMPFLTGEGFQASGF